MIWDILESETICVHLLQLPLYVVFFDIGDSESITQLLQ